MASQDVILSVKDLQKYFTVTSRRIIGQKVTGKVHAVDHLTFDVYRGETLGLVGESGCGKTTTARTILGLTKASGGEVFFDDTNLLEIWDDGSQEERMEYRRRLKLIFQNPWTSLNPRMPVKDIVSEGFQVHGLVKKEDQRDRLYSILEDVGLEPYHAERFPHQFSGGQRQRIVIARALSVDPEFIFADEPVASLDVSIRAQILNLMTDLQHRKGLTYVYISHDLASVRQICARVIVMYLGEIVEVGPVKAIFENFKHHYTQALMKAIPVPDPDRSRERIVLWGEVPSPINPPHGCRFHPRCPAAQDKCAKEKPEFTKAKGEHYYACWFPVS
ncbi:MAG: ABC transporter ATP-binding protein [Candidatus Hodarchaeota archaeon]